MQIKSPYIKSQSYVYRFFCRQSIVSAILFSSGLISSNSLHAGESTILTPTNLTTPYGASSEPGVGALVANDQQGDADDWLNYVEFYPDAQRHVSQIEFEAPVNFINEDIENLRFNVNFRGPEESEQRWQWEIRNFVTNQWDYLGDNVGVPDWQWTNLTYTAGTDASDYVNILGNLTLRYTSPAAIDNSNLDSVSIELTLPDSVVVKPPVTDGEIWAPTPGTSWQWQLTGTIDTSFSVQMYDIDLFDAPQSTIDELRARNIAVVCYFSAGSFENWRVDASEFPNSVLGSSNGWEGERWLDIRQLDALAPVLNARLDLAAAKGCDGVEPDNIDGYTNYTGFPLSAQDQLNFNIWLAQAAHARGLSIGLKNDLDQVEQLEPWFDWALNEQCVQYNECDLLTPFVEAGKAVFGVEYSGTVGEICSTTNSLDFDWLVKSLDLGAPRRSCR